MRYAHTMTTGRMVLAIATALFGCLVVCTVPVGAQQGDNTVWAGTSPAKAPSSAFIDAIAFCATAGSCTGSDDFCAVVNKALNTLPGSGGTIDARGVNAGGSNSCAKSPFISPNTINTPSTILLPAGTITISKVWVLPNGTKIIGQGAGASGYAVTTIQASSVFASTGTMIQMGPNSSDSPLTACTSAIAGFCTEVAVEDLALNGGASGATINGIVNGQSQDMSYVRRVSFSQIGGIGLKVWSNAQNSGPYSDIAFDSGTIGSTGTECAVILRTSSLNVPTRGIHGLTCSSESTTSIPAVAVQLDSSNNSIKDVRIQGFTDGITIGSTQNVASNVLFNITGGTNVSNVVHLPTGHTVKDISIMGVGNGGNSSSNTIKDEWTSTTLSDTYVAMYVLGESIPIGGANLGYSRFTTSTSAGTNAVTWGGGSITPSGSCSKGSLYSYATGGTTGNLYVCTGGTTWVAF